MKGTFQEFFPLTTALVFQQSLENYGAKGSCEEYNGCMQQNRIMFRRLRDIQKKSDIASCNNNNIHPVLNQRHYKFPNTVTRIDGALSHQ